MKSEDICITFLILVFVGSLVIPFGHTVTGHDVSIAENACKDHGGVRHYNTWLFNTVTCIDDEAARIGFFTSLEPLESEK